MIYNKSQNTAGAKLNPNELCFILAKSEYNETNTLTSTYIGIASGCSPDKNGFNPWTEVLGNHGDRQARGLKFLVNEHKIIQECYLAWAAKYLRFWH